MRLNHHGRGHDSSCKGASATVTKKQKLENAQTQVWDIIRALLAETFKRASLVGPSFAICNDPDYAQAFGMAKTLHLMGFTERAPSEYNSEFGRICDAIRDLVTPPRETVWYPYALPCSCRL